MATKYSQFDSFPSPKSSSLSSKTTTRVRVWERSLCSEKVSRLPKSEIKTLLRLSLKNNQPTGFRLLQNVRRVCAQKRPRAHLKSSCCPNGKIIKNESQLCFLNLSGSKKDESTGELWLLCFSFMTPSDSARTHAHTHTMKHFH